MLALLERDLEPGVVALELPLPVHCLGPEAALLLLARAFRGAGRPPRADQVIERLQGSLRDLLGRRVGGRKGRHGEEWDQERQADAPTRHGSSLRKNASTDTNRRGRPSSINEP